MKSYPLHKTVNDGSLAQIPFLMRILTTQLKKDQSLLVLRSVVYMCALETFFLCKTLSLLCILYTIFLSI